MNLFTHKYIYRINNADKITYVDQDWLQFALRNEAPELTWDRVNGTTLWDYVDGIETRELYQQLFHRLRRENSMTIIPYRCDSPTMSRSFDLYIRALDDGGLEMSSEIVSLGKKEYNPLLDSSIPRTTEVFNICSLCKRVQFPDKEWGTLEHALLRINLNDVIAPRLEHVICPHCNRSFKDKREKND